MIQLKNLSKTYGNKTILDQINFEVCEGEKTVILGKSGSGKTTLLNIVATIDRHYRGEVLLFGKNLKELSDSQIAKIRRDDLGFVFQDFGLLENLTGEDNIFLPLRSAGAHISKDEYFEQLVDVLHIGGLLNKYPSELSGGEKQRISIARALVKKPKLVVADEMTSALDIQTSSELIKYLNNVVNRFKTTLLIVTHDLNVAEICNSRYFLQNGTLQPLRTLREAQELFARGQES